METIVDVVSCVVSPYLIYLGEIGVTPKVISVEAEEVVTMQRVPGRRLGNFLREGNIDRKQFGEIYRTLGSHVGIISHYGILHGHLHSDNVVFNGNHPVIIDWGMASSSLPYDEKGETGLMHNGMVLMDDLDTYLSKMDIQIKRDLEISFKRGFNQGFSRKDLLSSVDVQKNAERILYGRDFSSK